VLLASSTGMVGSVHARSLQGRVNLELIVLLSLCSDECIQNVSPQGVKCLHNTCVAVNATLDSTCIYENTIYSDYVNVDLDYGAIVSR
jgi:hypothetical protein